MKQREVLALKRQNDARKQLLEEQSRVEKEQLQRMLADRIRTQSIESKHKIQQRHQKQIVIRSQYTRKLQDTQQSIQSNLEKMEKMREIESELVDRIQRQTLQMQRRFPNQQVPGIGRLMQSPKEVKLEPIEESLKSVLPLQ